MAGGVMARKLAVFDPHPITGKKYPFDEMEVGDYMVFASSADAGRAVVAGNGHACKPHTQGRKYSQRMIGPRRFVVTRTA